MKFFYHVLTCALSILCYPLFGQCPPPGFPDAGNTCVQAPVLCENLDGYCNTINNNNQQQNFPGCGGQFVLNNDEWFAFFAGTTSITIQVTPTNCTPGPNMGLQGGIYSACVSQPLALQCQCTQNPFILSSNNFVVGQIYYFVLDGCAGNVCDYSITVLSGSTVGVPPNDPGPITGLQEVCQNSTTGYSLPPVGGATTYTWTLTPNIGTISGSGPNVNVSWGNNTTSADLCVTTANGCYANPTPSCITIDVIPTPTATISGSGQLCQGGGGTVNLTVTFTGEGPWTFTPTFNGSPQAPITTSENPYTYTVNQVGNYGLQNVSVPGGANGCNGTVSGSASVTQVTINTSATVINSQCGLDNGGINLTVSGGSQPYLFQWSNGATTEDLSNIPAGSYTVTITEATGCTREFTATVNDNIVNLNITANVTANTTCNGGNGAIDVSVNPPPGNYTYQWSNGATTQDINNLEPGAYTITVTAGPTCSNTATFNVGNNPNQPNVTGTTTQSTCELDNGSININVSGGVPPYLFTWSNGSTSEDLNNIPAGSYSVTVTGANGCTQVGNFTVGNNNPTFNINANITANTTCIGGNGAINLNVTPANPNYTYTWSNGATTPNLSNLEPGSYTVTVSAGGACTQTNTFTIPNNPNNPNINPNVIPSTCELSNGSISISVTGGVSPYTFQWSNGSSSQNLSNIPAGSYTLTVTGANGCSSVANINVNNNNPPITINGTPVANTTCSGGNGSISISVAPPNPNYTYTWSNGATTPNINNLPPGTYTVTVNAGGACTQTASFTVADNPNLPVINITPVSSTCDQSNGGINLSVSGGVMPYTFSWTNGATTQNLVNIPAGFYGVTVTGANGCTASTGVNVSNENPLITVNGNVIANTLCNGNGNGSITTSVAPPGVYTYSWSNGATTPSISNLVQGTYTVTVTGSGSCSQIASFTIPENPNGPTINGNPTSSTCDLSNGGINITVSGAVPPYTYQWSSGQTTQNINNVPAGSYSVTVTGANGCTNVANFDIGNNNPPINVTGNATINTVCVGGNGAITLNVTPPALGPYTYQWSSGQTTQNINGLPGGTYTVTVQGQGSCFQTATFDVIDQPNVPIIFVEYKFATCGLSNGGIDLTVSSGVPPYTYQWSSGQTTQDLNNVPPDFYSVTVTSANGCTSETSGDLPDDIIDIIINGTVLNKTSCTTNNGRITLQLNPAPPTSSIQWSNGAFTPVLNNLAAGSYTVTVTVGTCSKTATFVVLDESQVPSLTHAVTPATCGVSNGSIDLTVTGGQAPVTFAWSNGATTEDLNNLPPGNYAVTVSAAGNCSAVSSITIPSNDVVINLSGTAVENTSCLTPNGSITLNVTPAGNYTYNWSNSANTPNISNLAPGSYSVTVSTGLTCSATASFNIANNATAPNLAAAATPSICGLNNGSASANPTGGMPPYTFSWSNSGNTNQINDLAQGNYSVTVTGANGCSSTATANVVNNNVALNVTGVISENTSCTTGNGAVNISVSPAGNYTYNWSNSATTEDLNNLNGGSYTVTVSAGGSCSSTATFTVTNNTQNPIITPTVTPSICSNDNGGIDLNISGASAPYTFVWSNGATTEDLANIFSGNYSVTVTASNGCTATTTLNVPNNSSTFSLGGSATPVTNCATPNGSVNLVITPPGNFIIEWSNNATSEDLSNVPPGTYTVSVTDPAGTGCTATASFIVDDNTTLPTASQTVTPEVCDLENGGVDLNVNGGTAPYTYNWSNNATTQDLNNVAADTYTVTVTDANNCTTTATATVPDNSITFSIAGSTSPNTICGTSNGSIDLTVTPVGVYTYNWSNNATSQNLNGLVGGNYSVTVSAGGSCTSVASFNVGDNTLSPAIAEIVAPASCAKSNGGIDLSVSGGEAPYTYSWSNSATNEDLSNIPAGNYSVTVTGANGCSSVDAFVVPDNVITPGVSGTTTSNTSCSDNNGSVTIGVTPPDNYTFTWSNAQTSQNLTSLAPGDYSVTVSAGGNCTSVATFTVGDDTPSPDIDETVTAATCAKSNGSIGLSVSGGEAPYTYQWSNNSNGVNLSNIPAGNYSVTVTGDNGCSSVANITVPDGVITPNVSGSTTPSTSCVDNNGTITVSVTPPDNYTFVWSNAQTSQDLANVAPGDYTVTVSSGGACTAVATFTVASNTAPVLFSGATTDIKCFGGNEGTIDLSVTSGTAPYQFAWSPNQPGNPANLTDLVAGNYTVTVTDAEGCTSTATFNISQPASAAQIACSATATVSAPGLTDGAGQVNVSGGTTPYVVNWSPGGTPTNVSSGTLPLNNLGTGTYVATVTDANGCTDVCDFTVGLFNCNTAVGDMSNAPLFVCGPECITATYNSAGEFLDANDVRQFVLHTGSGGQIVNEIARSSQPTFCFDPATMTFGTTYYISAIAGNNDGSGNVDLSDFCAVISVGTPISFREKPAASITAPEPITCAVKTVTLTGSSSLTGSSFQWTTVGGSIVGNPAQATITVDAAGNYRLTVNANGCADTTAVTVNNLTNQPKASIAFNPSDVLDCTISEIILSGTIEGTTAPNTIWILNGAFYSGGNPVPVTQAGFYEFIVLDTITSCSDTASITINENLAFPPLFINPPGFLTCFNTTVTLTGGSPVNGINFRWATINGADTTIVGTGTTLTVSQPGTYYLIGNDPSNNCINLVATTVSNDQSIPTADAGTAFSIACFGELATINGSATGVGTLSYQWTSPDGNIVSGSNTLTPTIDLPGTYTLVVTIVATGCTATDQVVIEPKVPVIQLRTNQPPCYNDRGAIVVESVEGGKPPIRYSLNGDVFTQNTLFTNLLPGDYTIVAIDAVGCSATATTTIVEGELLEITLETRVVIKLGDSYQINTEVTVPPSELAVIQWTPNTGLDCDTCLNPLATPLTSTQYRLNVASQTGCKADARLLLLVDKSVDVYVPNVFSPNGDSENDVFMIFADTRSVVKIKSFQIYSRWGELVSEHYDFLPNDPAYGWDGRHRGQTMNPAVFVWYAVIELFDGQEVLYEGDVTLLR
ncbi:MAG: gliding motility-associated C-terminal domain-containing protein [Saprospiraceae bacterium]|nr:gliding motility-associated C-terminal domain-containing protein [Saprospiraceae bacterium]